MSWEIVCSNHEGIDRIEVRGQLDTDASLQLAQTISQLRRQGDGLLLWVGPQLTKVYTQQTNCLVRPLSLLRHFGGRIALADFQPQVLREIKRSPWHRFLNIFTTESEALQFLQKPTSGPPIEPVIEPVTEEDEEAVDEEVSQNPLDEQSSPSEEE